MQNFRAYKLIITLLIIVSAMLFPAEAIAKSYANVSTDAKITAALDSLKGTKNEWVINAALGENLTGKPVKIMFQKLAYISTEYKNYNALACKDRNGNMYILIDSSHANAPKEAVASLLSHEMLHQDEFSSIAEETQAWTSEAIQWTEFTAKNSKLAENNSELVKRLNTLSNMYAQAGNSSELIKLEVMLSEGYATLAMKSPGFGF